jgi:hypothetical protein
MAGVGCARSTRRTGEPATRGRGARGTQHAQETGICGKVVVLPKESNIGP